RPAMKTFVFCLLLAGALAAPSRKLRFRLGNNYKIVGGTDAEPGEFPYQLSLQDISWGLAFDFCGAALYKENWAISSGHCIEHDDFDNPDYLQAVAGEHDKSVNEGNEQSSILSKIILHEDFDGYYLYNDISLLQLSTPLTLNEYVDVISLPEQGHEASGDCVVTGWGDLEEGGHTPNILQKVTVPIVSDSECRDDYSVKEISDSMICAGYPQGGKDSCQGDSGGPLACDDGGYRYLAGIVSWGYGCARPNYPGVYTEVAYFSDWIQLSTL
ncbi:hypothetical protein OTU49_016058, partial [Cherax quadricarinatus]